jgi:phage tail protein X
MASAPVDRDFDDTKAEGDLVEWLLLDLLAAAGCTVQPHQANLDLAAKGSAARAYGPDGIEIHLPDLEVPAPRRLGFEVKSKERLRKGGFGWDAKSFQRAAYWQRRVGVPVLYAIRDKSITPVPAGLPRRSELDALDPWRVASLHRLNQYGPNRITRWRENWDGDREPHETWYWPEEVFTPLSVLLEGGFAPDLLGL